MCDLHTILVGPVPNLGGTDMGPVYYLGETQVPLGGTHVPQCESYTIFVELTWDPYTI